MISKNKLTEGYYQKIMDMKKNLLHLLVEIKHGRLVIDPKVSLESDLNNDIKLVCDTIPAFHL